jgi:hypothetical protein
MEAPAAALGQKAARGRNLSQTAPPTNATPVDSRKFMKPRMKTPL